MNAQTAKDPSMEDILDSIRKIIAEGDQEEVTNTSHHDGSKISNSPDAGSRINVSDASASRFSRSSSQSQLPTAKMNIVAAPAGSRIPESSASVNSSNSTGKTFLTNTGSVKQSAPSPLAKSPAIISRARMDAHLEEKNRKDKTFPSKVKLETSFNDTVSRIPKHDSQTNVAHRTDAKNLEQMTSSEETVTIIDPDEDQNNQEENAAANNNNNAAANSNALMSLQSDNTVINAFEQLKNSITDNLDDKVDALLRPVLREWLDSNLPSMVERLVRNEIERVSRGE